MLRVTQSASPFELLGMGPSTRPPETRFQRFERLQAECKALLDEVTLEGKALGETFLLFVVFLCHTPYLLSQFQCGCCEDVQ
jgi:hypothetical protein